MKRVAQLIAALALVVVPLGGTAGAQVPVDDLEVILAIDTSGSMRPAIAGAKAAANKFVASMPEGVRIGVETFADEVTVLTAPTTDRDLLTWQINSIVTGGDTALYDVVVTASQHFSSTTEHKVLVILSDGRDEGSVATLDDAIAAAAGLRVEAISLTTAETDLASLTSFGPVTSADDDIAVAAAFERISDLIVEVVEPTTVPSSAPPATTIPATTIAVVTVPSTTTASTIAPATVVASPPPSAPAAVVTAREASPSAVWLWVGGGGVFGGLFLLALLLIPQDRVSKARLGVDKPRSVSDMGVRTMSAIEQALERRGKRADLSTALAVADISMKPAEFVAMAAVFAIIAGLVGLLLGGPLIALVVAAFVGYGFRFHVHRAKSKRQAAFAEQLTDVLQLVMTALRSGFGLTQALETVTEASEEPARSEFAHVLVEVRLGRDLTDAMTALAQRMENKDLEWVVSAIDINRATGGNLSEILHHVGLTIRERGRIQRQVQTLTAEGRLSARILTVMPLLLIVWQWRANPDNFALLTHGPGLVALCFAGVLMLVGATWVQRIVKSVAL